MIAYLEKRKKVALAFLVIIAVEIFLVSSIPGQNFGTEAFDASIAYHFIVFFLLNFFTIIFVLRKEGTKARGIVISVFFSLIYAILDETHQIFVPSRTPSTSDLLIDSLGILSSAIVYLYYKRNHQNNKSLKNINQKLKNKK